MQLHENSMRLWNASKVFVYKYINIKKQWFVKFLLFLHLVRASGNAGYFQDGGTLVSKLPTFNTLFAFVVLTLFKLPDPGASIFVQSLLKFPTWGAQGRLKSPPRPVVPPPRA